jgi:hypothetical protein
MVSSRSCRQLIWIRTSQEVAYFCQTAHHHKSLLRDQSCSRSISNVVRGETGADKRTWLANRRGWNARFDLRIFCVGKQRWPVVVWAFADFDRRGNDGYWTDDQGLIAQLLPLAGRASAAEDRQLKYFEETINIDESDCSQPLALILDRRQEVGRLVRPANEFSRDLVA